MKRKKSKTTKRRAVRDLTTRKIGRIKGKAGGGACKVNVGDLAFTHYEFRST